MSEPGTELQSILTPRGGRASFPAGEALILDGSVESLMVNLQYLTEPAHIPLSSHQKHSLSRGVAGERQRWLEPSLSSCAGTLPGLILTEWLTIIFQLQLAGAGQGL